MTLLHYIRLIFLSLLVSFSCLMADCQVQTFSFSIDAGLLRSFRKEQQFWALGQTLTGTFGLTSKSGVYVFLNYHINGKFRNDLTATAKSPATNPQEIAYRNSVKLNFSHISAGWKRYLFGTFERDTKPNFYAYAGLGLMMGRIENTGNVIIDTAAYTFPVNPGKGKFKRLTVDLGIGYEIPIGGSIFFYIDGRTLVPVTDYPTPYLLVNDYAPVTASAYIGLRMLFD